MNLAACGEANDTEFATTRTGGAKNVQDKGRGSLTRPRPATPPRRAGRGFSIGGRNFHFLLWQVAVNEENRGKTVSFTGGFQRFCGDQRGGHFSPPGVKPGVSFSSALTTTTILPVPGGDMRRI